MVLLYREAQKAIANEEKMVENRSDFDNPWKEAISLYFQPFMGFFFPRIEEEIDWGEPKSPSNDTHSFTK